MTSVFHIDGSGRLSELRRADYDSEALLQRLLAEHPAVLGATDPAGGRLLLVRRELGVPDEAGGSDRWSLDHLFIDGDGVPVLVEVKRATDTRIRREVVAQMLDYAANGIAHWPIERVVAAFREGVEAAGGDPDAELMAFLGEGRSADAFWRQVEANLRAGRIRMVFAADRIPPELRRIVVFLNEQMRPAEVLAVEIEQFVGADGHRTLVPRAVGDTDRARAAKAVREAPPALGEEGWLSALATEKGDAARSMAERAIAWFRAEGFGLGVTESGDSLYANLPRPGGRIAWPFFLRRSTGRVETSLQYLANTEAYAAEANRLDLLRRIQALPGATTGTAKATGWPAIPLAALAGDATWTGFQAIAREVRARIEAEASGTG